MYPTMKRERKREREREREREKKRESGRKITGVQGGHKKNKGSGSWKITVNSTSQK